LQAGRQETWTKSQRFSGGENGTETYAIEGEKRETMVGQGDNGLDTSACGTIQQERAGDRAHAGVEEGVAERAGIGDADAYVLYQPRGTQPERAEASGIEAGEEAAFGRDTAGAEIKNETEIDSSYREKRRLKRALGRKRQKQIPHPHSRPKAPGLGSG
jgi:hypothetical protein